MPNDPIITTAKQTNCTCCECGARFYSANYNVRFCAVECRRLFNNRRMVRGAELYDLIMEMRFNRGRARLKHIWTMVCAVASAYRAADTALRDGRQSWCSDAHLRIPMAYSTQGDGR